MSKSTVFAAALSVVLCAACTERLTAPEAVELVNTLEESQRLGEVWRSDLRLTAALTVDLERDGDSLPYRAIVFERVVVPGQLVSANCAGTRRSAHFWRPDGEGVAFFPDGAFDQRLVPALGTCQRDSLDRSSPLVTVVTPSRGPWLQSSVEGEIEPGTVTGPCRFLEPEAERVLREEHGITCELTSHRVRLGALLVAQAGAGPDSLRFDLDADQVVGVRYMIDCDAARSKASVPCAAPSGRSRP